MRALEQASWWNAGMRDVAGSLLRKARLPASGLLVDVGCGSGQTMSWFTAERRQWRAIGLDLSLDGLDAASHAGQTVMQASALDLPCKSGCADLVITLDVLQHLPLPGGDVRALEEMRRVIKPGGALLIRTNAQAFPHTNDDSVFNFRKYTPDGLHRALAVAGFDVVALGRVNMLPGLAEIPRELRARRTQSSEYHGILSKPRPAAGWPGRLKRGWLRLEGAGLVAGWQLPFGRTIFALCRLGLTARP